MSKSYEERMAEKYNFLKKEENTSSEVTDKNIEQDEKVSNEEVIDAEAQKIADEAAKSSMCIPIGEGENCW